MLRLGEAESLSSCCGSAKPRALRLRAAQAPHL